MVRGGNGGRAVDKRDYRIGWQEWGAISSQQGRSKEAVSLSLSLSLSLSVSHTLSKSLTLAKSSYLEQAWHGGLEG